MKKVLIFVLLSGVFSGLLNAINLTKEIYFKFSVTSKSEINKLTKIISIDNVKNNEVFAYANKSEFEKFLQRGYSYQILPNPSTLIKAEMANSCEQMRSWDYYPTYETYVSLLYQFEEDYPNLCRIENIGTTVNNREILFAKISDNVDVNEDEPEFMYTATIHGDELVGYVLMLRLIDYLLSLFHHK
jgi:murein tripeptide amidase MpaA